MILSHWYYNLLVLRSVRKLCISLVNVEDKHVVKFIHVLCKVGDFGLARWQPDGDTGVDTRVIGTFG